MGSPKFSIRYKFLFVTTFLLVLCVGAYLLIATKVFKEDKTELVFDYNSNLVSNISSDVESFFQSVTDKMNLTAYFFRDQNWRNQQVLQQMLKNKSHMVYVSGSTQFKKLDQEFYFDKVFGETYAVDKAFFQKELLKLRPIPYQRIQTQGEAIWNATVENGPPLIGYGRSVVEENSKGIPIGQFAVVSFIDATQLSKSLSRSHFNEVFMTNHLGEMLIHPDPHRMLVPTKKQMGIGAIALGEKVRTGVKSFSQGEKKMMGAFSKAFNNRLLVLSQVSEEKAFAAVDRLVLRSLNFATIVITMAFIVAIFFSRHLTKPLEVLVGGMKKVSGGDLNTHIQVNSSDEIAMLAGSFNHMISDLKQSRDELEKINRELEDKVKERTKQLEEQNQAVKKAQEALLRTTRLAAVGEVAGQAAHEVLNPLTGIISRLRKVQKRIVAQQESETQLLKDIQTAWKEDVSSGGFEKLEENWKNPSQIDKNKTLFDEDMNNLQQITQNIEGEFKSLDGDVDFLIKESERINKIVNSMRSMSRVTSDAKLFSLHQLLKQSVNVMADLASQYDIEIDIKAEAPEDKVMIDEDEFIQVMTNLLRNAMQSINMRQDHYEKGLVQIRTVVVQSELHIEIKDNGMGISDLNKKRLFEKHFSTKSKKDGTGIGLAISRRLIRAFKGDIYLKSSQLGQGTTFVVSLPLAYEEERKPA